MDSNNLTATEPFSGSTGDATRPGAGRFDWLNAAAHDGGWQFGEQGVLAAIFDKIGTVTRECVEFGAGDDRALPLTCGRLIDAGWRATLIESDLQCCEILREKYVHNENVRIFNRRVEVHGESCLDNVLDRMTKSGIGGDPVDLLVIDVDSIDWYIFEAMKTRRMPRVVCIEHHDLEHTGPEADSPIPPSEQDCGKRLVIEGQVAFALQASAAAVGSLGESKGYVVVFRTRVNTIMVRADLADKLARPMVRLNVGSGDVKIDGYVSLDLKNGDDARSLPYADGSVDEVYASHLLEHFDYTTEVADVLREWARVLVPGGLMRISVPDVAKYCRDRNETNSFMLDRFFLGGQKDSTDRHGSAFDEAKLRQAMNAAGIGDIQPFDSFVKDCSSIPISLNLEGRKRSYPALKSPRVCMILSQPRLTFSSHESCLIQLAQRLRFEHEMSKGAFWDRDMTITTQIALAKYHPDVLLYTDYDSVFTARDAMGVIDTLMKDPSVAVVGVVQMERHGDKPLVFDTEADYSDTTTRVRFQHFGLTAVRASVFRELPLPWFWSIPGHNGGWGEWNRSDADITFWRMLRTYGFNVVQRNDIVIGHSIVAIKWPKPDGSGVILQPEEMYNVHGKPANAKFAASVYLDKLKKEREAK